MNRLRLYRTRAGQRSGHVETDTRHSAHYRDRARESVLPKNAASITADMSARFPAFTAWDLIGN